MNRVNLIPRSVVNARVVRRRVRAWLFGGAGAAPAVVGAAGLYAALAVQPTGALGESLDAERARALSLGEEIERIEEEIVDRSSVLALRRRITETPRWSPLFLMLARRLSDRVALESLALVRDRVSVDDEGRATGGGYRVTLSGRTDSTQTLSEVLLDLEQEALFGSVRLVSSQSRDDSRGLIGFQIECVIGAGLIEGGGGVSGGVR